MKRNLALAHVGGESVGGAGFRGHTHTIPHPLGYTPLPAAGRRDVGGN